MAPRSKSVRENKKFNDAPEQLVSCLSREAAKDFSPRRKAWGNGTPKSPEGAKEASGGAVPRGNAAAERYHSLAQRVSAGYGGGFE